MTKNEKNVRFTTKVSHNKNSIVLVYIVLYRCSRIVIVIHDADPNIQVLSVDIF